VTGSRTVTVTWLPPPLEQQNGQIVYYILIITDSQLGSNSEINSTTTSFMATGLKEYNNYSCIVAAATTVGLGPYSLPVRFTTQQGGKLPYLHSTVVESVIKYPMESDTISTTCFVSYFGDNLYSFCLNSLKQNNICCISFSLPSSFCSSSVFVRHCTKLNGGQFNMVCTSPC